MSYLDVNLAVPIGLLVASIVGVILVRLILAQGDRRAKARTKRLIAELGTTRRVELSKEQNNG